MTGEGKSRVGRETEKGIPSFEGLSFGDIELKLIYEGKDLPERSLESGLNEYSLFKGEIETSYNGRTLPVHVEKIILRNQEGLTSETIKFYLGEPKLDFYVLLEINTGEESLLAYSDVHKNKALMHDERYRGLGMVAYAKMLDYIALQSIIKKVPIVHNIRKVSIMSHEKWLSILMPILTERNYRRVENERDTVWPTWRKTYFPVQHP